MTQVQNSHSTQQKNLKRFNSPQCPQRIIRKPDHTTSDLFGDYREEPVIKIRPEKFEPTFEIKSANIRKNLEIYGTDKQSNHQNIKEEKANGTSDMNATQKKMNEQSSNIFNQEIKVIEVNQNNIKEKIYPNNANWKDPDTHKKLTKDQNCIEKQNNGKKNTFQKDFLDTKNSDKRKGDRNYSDLFGRETLASPKLNEKNKTCSTMKWTDVDSSKTKNKDIDANTSPKKRKIDESKSALDTENLQKIREVNIQVPVEKEKEKKFVIDKENTAKCLKNLQMESNIIPDYKLPFTDRKINNEAKNNAEMFDFDIKGLSDKFDQNRFNLFCKKNGYHIVSFKSDFNSVLNKCGADGRLQLRANDNKAIAAIKSNLKDFGIEVAPHTDHLAKNSNYLETANVDWKEDALPKEERRLHSRNYLSPQHSKMQDLESNGDVFGNTLGVGKWGDEWKNSHINEKKWRNAKEPEKKKIENGPTTNKRSSKVFEPVLASRK